MRRWALLSLIPVLLASPGAGPSPAPAGPSADLRAIDRDNAAAEAALAAGELDAALRYFQYVGHEQEDFARASLEHRIAREKFGAAVREAFGRREWSRAARALGVPRRRGRNPPQRSLRRDGDVLYVKTANAAAEVPYVHADGVWKLSVRDVLLAGVRARLGPDVEYEEADLFNLAGKMGRVLRARAAQLTSLADDVRAGHVKSSDELHAAVTRIRHSAGEPPPRE